MVCMAFATFCHGAFRTFTFALITMMMMMMIVIIHVSVLPSGHKFRDDRGHRLQRTPFYTFVYLRNYSQSIWTSNLARKCLA